MDTPPSQPSSEISKGILLAAIATALFSAKGIWIKLAYQHGVDTVTLMSLRMLFSLPIYLLLGFYWWQRGQFQHTSLGRHTIPILAVGVLGYYLASFLDLQGLNYVSAQLERLVLFAYPTITVLLSYLLMKRPIKREMIWVLPASWAGVLLMVMYDWQSQGDKVLLGTAWVAAAAVVFAFYMIYSKPLIAKVGSRLFTCVAMTGASVAILLHYLAVHSLTQILGQPWQVYLYGVIIAVFSTVLPSFMFSDAIRRIGPERCAVTGTLGPVFTALAAVWVLGEAFTLFHLFGMALVLGSISYMARRASSEQKRNLETNKQVTTES